MLAWTHTWERVYAHTCCLDMYACLYAQPHTNTVWIWTCTCEHETHVCKCVSHHLLSVHISTYLPITLVTGMSAQLGHADKHSGISQPASYHKQKINIFLKIMFHMGPTSRSLLSPTCPFLGCKALVLYGNINLCRSTFSIHSLSSLMLFHITPAVYGL